VSLLAIEALTVAFRSERGEATAVEDVSLSLEPGEILGVVGESGSGKSVTALSVMGLLPEPAARVVGGRVVFEGQALTGMAERRLRRIRGPGIGIGIGMVFQEPMTSLNPVFSIGEQITETLAAHAHQAGGERDSGKRRDRAVEMLERVGIPSAARRLGDYPHQLSGGQRQRVGIARALILQPRFLLCDEPVSALDVSVQAGIVNLLQDLQAELGVAMLFIAHDLGVVRHVSDRVAVMYLGRVVEQAEKRALYARPMHPYTQALIASVPALSPAGRAERRAKRARVGGDIPGAMAVPSGCRFHPRCPHAMPKCRDVDPALADQAPGHSVACHLY